MRPDVRPWLPSNAIDEGWLARRLTAGAEAWAARWFGSSAGVRAIASRYDRGRLDEVFWETEEPGLWACAEPQVRLAMAAKVLGAPQKKLRNLTKPDRSLLHALAGAAIEDLLHALAETFSLGARTRRCSADDRAAGSGRRYSISLGSDDCIEICVDHGAAVAARRAALAPAEAPAGPGSRAEAINRQMVSLGAMVGASQLGLADLAALAPGDVLVLDRGRDDALALTVNGSMKSDAGCALRRDGLSLKLSITQLG